MRRRKGEVLRRDEFLEAALNRFARYGYAATSTREICADVGIVHSAIYNYFPTKEAVLLAIEAREMTRMQGGLDALLANSREESAVARLTTAIRYTLEVAVNGREAWHLMAEMLRSLTSKNRAQVIARRDRYEHTIRNLIIEAIKSGTLPAQDVRLTSLHIFGIAGGIAGWYRPDGDYSAKHIVENALEVCLRIAGALGTRTAVQSRRSGIASQAAAR